MCLNPTVPSWIITTQAASLLLTLCDGQNNVDDIAEFCLTSHVGVDRKYVRNFFQSARTRKLFDPPAEADDSSPWETRRLTAMHLHLTDRCNLQCSYCLRNSTPHIPIRHDPEKFLGMLEFIKPFSIPNLRITYAGGEPLTYPGFQEVVEASSAHGYINELLTNGMLITKKRAEFIARNFSKVRISLDGPDRATHAISRGDNFNQVIRGIRRIAEHEVDLTAQVTVTNSNLEAVSDDMRDLLPEKVHIAYTPMLPFGRGAEEQSEFITSDAFLDVSRAAVKNRGDKVKALFSPGIPTFSPCHAGYSNLSIADTGDVYPCHLFHEEKFHFGNIFHDDFESIFFGEKIQDYVKSMDVRNNNPFCAACEMRLLCAGGCKANTLHSTGNHKGRDLYCSFIKRSIVDNMIDSSELGPGGKHSQCDTGAIIAASSRVV